MYKPMSVRPFCTLCESAFQEEEHVVIIKEDAEQPLQSVEFNMSQLEFIKSGATGSTEASETTNSDPDVDADLDVDSNLDSDSTLNSEGLSWSDYLRYNPRVEPAQPSDEDILSKISKLPPEITHRLSNEPNDEVFSVLIRPPSDGINTFYVAHDHLGVRKVVFAIPDNEKAPATVEDTVLWWETITFEANHTPVNVISDGVKVQSLYRTPGLKRPAKTYWPSLMKPQDHPRVARLNRGAKGLPMVKRLRPLVLNDVGMKALSACCCENSDYSRHIPSDIEPMWLHLVLDEGERIAEIWGWQTFSRSSDLVLRTNKGRIWNIGPIVSEREPFNWNHFVDLPTREQSTIYFDESLRGINQLAFQEKKKPLVDAKAAPEVMVPPPPARGRRISYFYFSERLKDLLTVTPCWIKSRKCLMQITGLVLRYGDGRVRTLGVVRLDCLAEPIDVTASAVPEDTFKPV
ncbi:unnamed protein product [Fusarium graminearum]|uniref:Uncharacterized protein n=1 Tax=Gibberella zeae TaxID=5518 RepID=A0A9N8RGK6_GIBZA|nr:unnamed protein product [Fusarium graminearum]